MNIIYGAIKYYFLRTTMGFALWLANAQIVLMKDDSIISAEGRGYRTDALNFAPQLMRVHRGQVLVVLDWYER